MDALDDIVEQLTARLRVDLELRMDVANELRTHLEDAAGEFRQAGASEEEAHAQAVKALGDPDELAEQLWQANRGRIRFRRVARWAARVTLVPAAAVVTVLIGLAAYGSLVPIAMSYSPSGRDRAEVLREPLLEGLSAEQRFILEGDPAAKTPVEKARSIAERWPDDPIYYAQYIYVSLDLVTVREALRKRDMAFIAEAVAALDRGREIEPDNAFYDFLTAAVLIRGAGKTSKDPDCTYEVSRPVWSEPHTYKCFRLELTDPAMFRRGLDALEHGLTKPHCADHVDKIIARRLSVVPRPARLGDYIRRTGVRWSWSDSAPMWQVYRMCESVLARALDLARQGKRERAVELLRAVQLVAAKMGASSRWLAIAGGIRNTALGHATCLFDVLGLPEQAAKATEDLHEEMRFDRSIRNQHLSREELRHAAMVHRQFLVSVPGYRRNYEPLRSAEYAVSEQFALVVLLGLLVLAALGAGLVSVISGLLCRGRRDGPKLLFIGWRRLGRICLLAVALPIGVYALYAHAFPSSGREYGLHFTGERVVTEYMAVILTVLSLVLGMSYSAVRKRAADAGMPVPGPLKLRRRRKFIIVAALLGLAVAAYLVGWEVGHFRPMERYPEEHWTRYLFGEVIGGKDIHGLGAVLSGLMLGCMVVWGAYELGGVKLLRGELAHFRRTLFRSLVPILAAGVIVVGAMCGLALTYAESSAVARIEGSAALRPADTVSGSDLRLLRERFARQYKALLGQVQRARQADQPRPATQP